MASPKSGFFQDGKDDNTSVSSTAYITAPSSDVFFKQQFNSYTKNREVAGQTAPASGLYLKKIDY